MYDPSTKKEVLPPLTKSGFSNRVASAVQSAGGDEAKQLEILTTAAAQADLIDGGDVRNVPVQIADWGELRVGRPAAIAKMTEHVNLNGVIVVLKEFDD